MRRAPARRSRQRVELDLGLRNVWLYGTPNYVRGNGAYVKTEVARHGVSTTTAILHVINNNDDLVTDILARPPNALSAAWGTVACHDYSHWIYQRMSPVIAVCQ
jgi:hypothetical protein